MNAAKFTTLTSLTNTHDVRGRSTLKDEERTFRNGSIRELYERSIYERNLKSDSFIENTFRSDELTIYEP